MAAIDNYISVQVSLVQPGVSEPGFGTVMILSANASFSERARTYTDIDGVADDFATGSPEYGAASAIFAQSPHPEQIKIGRSALPPTLVYTIGVAAVRNSHNYKIHVEGEGVTATDTTATSDSSATNDEIADAIVTALNAVVGKNYTAAATGSGGSHVVTVTATAAGDWFSLSVETVDDLSIRMSHTNPGVATDLAAIKLADPDWYVVYPLYNSPAYAEAVSTWCEANGRAAWIDTNQSAAITAAVGGAGTDMVDVINTTGVKYTLCMYHPKPHQFPGAAWAGRYFATTPGQATAALKALSGVDPVTLTATQRTNLTNKRANSYELAAPGTPVTFDGTVPSSTYRYFDVVRDVDAWTADVQASVLGAFVSQDKVGFTDTDTPKIGSAIRGANKRAEEGGTAAIGSSFVTIPKVAAVSATDKSNRALNNVKAGFTLAGAVQSVGVRATITF